MVITEFSIKTYLKSNDSGIFILKKDMILTPSARQFLSEKGIEIIKEGDEVKTQEKIIEKAVEIKEILPKFKGINGEFYIEKGEYMTHLWKDILVPKNNTRIILRGKIDNLLAEWLMVHKRLNERKNQKLTEDLNEIFDYIKKIMNAEILDNTLNIEGCFKYSLDKIKEISHNPKKYFDTEHLFAIDATYDEIVLEMNRIRTIVRQLELSAVDAYYSQEGLKKAEIILALNRLSSAIYIIMLKGKSGKYGLK